ncbi:hypothetical protein VUR80DRAFT_6421 [Thermomyces stellatus]
MEDDDIQPAFPPPPGVTSNFDDPDNISWIVMVAIAATLPVAILACSLRLYTSKRIVGRWHVDDVLIAIAQLFSIGYSISMCFQAKYAMGRHIWDVPADKGLKGAEIEIIASAITYNLSLATTKASILFFYLRFPSSRLFRAACYLVLFVAAGNGLTAGFAFLYLCQPIERHWNRKIEGHCGNPAVPFWVAAIVNMCTDAIILFLPVWLLRPLRLGPAKTASVLCVLMAGSFVCGITIYRVIDIPKTLTSFDVTWDYVDNYMWCVIETNVAITCACLPCLKAFVKHHFGHTWLFHARTQHNVNRTLSFLRTRGREEWAAGDDPPWDGTKRSRRSMAYRELGDQQSDKSRQWGDRGIPSDGDAVELSESVSSGVVGRREGVQGPERV